MADPSLFPHFKPITLGDGPVIRERLQAYQPETSELTFTNLYMWAGMAGTRWCLHEEYLLLVSRDTRGCRYAMMPIGPPPRIDITRALFRWMRTRRDSTVPCIERADSRFAREMEQAGGFTIEPAREHFDYVYSRQSLADLSGRRFHQKKNHVNRFRRQHDFSYAQLDDAHVPACLTAEDDWCRAHHCCADTSLTGEWEAIRRVLRARSELGCSGGVVIVDNAVEAFTLGEPLNDDTAVVHIEKAAADNPDLYAVINQQFCQHGLGELRFVNREQDLGLQGLRQAKLSYHPERMVEKYRVTPATDSTS